jgi:hypothetical protein
VRRLTINDPWRLQVPQKVMDAIEQASALTGLPPEKIVAQTLTSAFNAAEAEKKKPRETSASSDRVGSDVRPNSSHHGHSSQLLLSLGE